METFRRLEGTVAALCRSNIDTDQIIPKQFLKRIERTGFGDVLFFDWRYKDDGTPNPDFELNQPKFAGASILVTGRNFGCGSSREHAPWALRDYGIRAIIAPSFADIFYNNCFKTGLLPVILPEERVEELAKKTGAAGGYVATVDLEHECIVDADGLHTTFTVDPFRRHCLMNALDEIALTLEHTDEIAQYEARRPAWLPHAADGGSARSQPRRH
ncbi:MAG: 3-isopropylmalate dehydratase small subunit [Armatimonadetes bacterium]|nr:3-isopropylmalate dehydratase small subunit [Armatimonadota bacterium]MDE2205978.1 3-isopropylmalate dehydratase small subunit [Armatimonadota bacterium]